MLLTGTVLESYWQGARVPTHSGQQPSWGIWRYSPWNKTSDTTIKTAAMDLTYNTCTTTGCRYVQAREQKLSKLYLKQKKTNFFFNLLSHQVQIFCSHHKIKLLVSCSGLKIFILILWRILLRKKYFTEPGCTICMHLWDMKSSKQILNIVVR